MRDQSTHGLGHDLPLEETPLPSYILLGTCHPLTSFGPLYVAPNPNANPTITRPICVRLQPNLARCDQETKELIPGYLGLIVPFEPV